MNDCMAGVGGGQVDGLQQGAEGRERRAPDPPTGGEEGDREVGR